MPTLTPGDIVVMDNLSAHKVEAARRLRADADRLGPKFDAKAWLTDNLGPCGKSPDELRLDPRYQPPIVARRRWP